MDLSHYSWKGTLEPYTTNDPEMMGRRGDKPYGLWVSVDGEDDWPAWCKREEFRDTDRQCHYRVTLHEDANILHLQNTVEMLEFSEEYGTAHRGVFDDDHVYSIDWVRLSEAYQGIIIAPYQQSAAWYSPETRWYSGWDCASGCIWDHTAIASVDLIRYGIPKLSDLSVLAERRTLRPLTN